MTTPQLLSQAELDDEYHLAYFECEGAALRAIFDYFAGAPNLRPLREDLENVIADALHAVEMKHLGEERYAAMMARMMARLPKEEQWTQ